MKGTNILNNILKDSAKFNASPLTPPLTPVLPQQSWLVCPPHLANIDDLGYLQSRARNPATRGCYVHVREQFSFSALSQFPHEMTYPWI